MKFLVDNQLPPALVRFLRTRGHDAIHVADANLDSATDLQIWNFASENDSVIISKDEDFLHLSTSNQPGPAFVWVRLGNCRTDALLAAFESVLLELVKSLDAGDRIVEVR